MEIFRNCIEVVMNNWSALEIAVCQGGGPYAKQHVIQMMDELVTMFYGNARLEPEDITDFLTDTLESRFSTECEDGSPGEVAAVLFKLFQCIISGNDPMLVPELTCLSSTRTWLSSCQNEKSSGLHIRAPDVPGNAGSSIQSHDVPSRSSDIQMEESWPDVTGDGSNSEPQWQEVKSRRK